MTPRWTPGSLAQYIGEDAEVQGQRDSADAVERLTRAARALVSQDRMDEAGPEIDALIAALEAAEGWKL